MKRLICFAVLISFCLLQGCMTARFEVSRPKIYQDSTIRVSKSGILNLGDIRISLRPYNFANAVSFVCLGLKVPKKFEEKPEHAFYIEIGMFAKDAGFELDPGNITLELADRQIKPVAVFGPSYQEEVYLKGLFFFEDFKKAFLNYEVFNLAELSSSLMVEPRRWTGVLLKFEAYPPPSEEVFNLYIDGLAKDGSEISIPQVTFQKGHAVVVDDVY